MDDCSSDNSCEVLQRWAEKDERITTLFNEINSGSPFAQWEKGANWAQGKYIWIAESDDYAAEDMLALHVQALESNHRAVLAYSHSRMADVNGKILRDFKEDYAFIFGDASKWSRDFIVSGKEEVARTMVFSNTIPNASGVLMRKSAFDQVGAPATTWLLNGDWLFYAQLLQLGDLIFFATLAISSGSMTKPNAVELWRATKPLMKFWPCTKSSKTNNGPPQKYLLPPAAK